ncbi:hypothetical protein PAMP_015693 [Pampus punctatissimus]
MIKTQLEPLYQETFPLSFRFLIVISFRSGSVINNIDLTFSNTSSPDDTQITNVLANASSTVTGFDIENDSITVGSTSVIQGETFTDDLNNSSSSQFKDLEQRLVRMFDDIYRKEFGSRFNRSFVKQIRKSSLINCCTYNSQCYYRCTCNCCTNNCHRYYDCTFSYNSFRQRASMIKRQLEPLYQRTFPSSFRSLDMVSFRNGSVINNMDLRFTGIFPNNTQIANVLINAASNVTGFDIETSSITVDGAFSNGVHHKISLVTASCLVVLSWLLSSQQ